MAKTSLIFGLLVCVLPVAISGGCSSAEKRPLPAPIDVPAPAALAPADDDGVIAEWAPEDDPAPPVPSEPVAASAVPLLLSTAKETFVYERPSFDSKKLGYLRAGAVVRRGAKPEGFGGCTAGFYQVEPGGYVCVGQTATLELDHPIRALATTRADRSQALPYRYGVARLAAPHFYTRLPTNEEQRQTELDWVYHARNRRHAEWAATTVTPPPPDLAEGQPLMSLHGHRYAKKTLHLGRAMPKSGFAFLEVFDAGERRFGLTVDMALLPLDRLDRVQASAFHGAPLGGEMTLPLAFVRSTAAYLYSGHPKRAGLEMLRKLEFREAVSLSGKSSRVGSKRYLETREGNWIVDDRLVRVDPMKNRPSWAGEGRRWIDVSILTQTLVAYEGDKAVFTTLVSTGKDGLGDPEKTHSTVLGRFLIHTKHVSVNMGSDEVGDEFDLRDVPYVQYFSEGYALHAAYWHDAFGLPRSHGCINLAPLDARWLFGWTTPSVPRAWHGAMSLKGTLVSIHP